MAKLTALKPIEMDKHDVFLSDIEKWNKEDLTFKYMGG